MKVTTSTRDLLVIKYRPWFFGGMIWLIGLSSLWAASFGEVEDNGLPPIIGVGVVGGIGLLCCLFAWAGFSPQDIRFDRKTGTIERRVKRLFAPKSEVVPLAELKRARVGKHSSEGTEMERLELVLEDRTWPMEWGYATVHRAAVVDAINGWMKGEVLDTHRSRLVAALSRSPGPRKVSAQATVPPLMSGIPDTRRDLE